MCQENLETYNATSSLPKRTRSYHEEPALSNITCAEVTLRQNLFGMRHVSCRTRNARIQWGERTLALDGPTERLYTTEMRRTPIRKVI